LLRRGLILINALVFLAQGFEEIETVTIIDVLRRGGIEVKVVSLKDEIVEGAHSVKIVSDTIIDHIELSNFDAIIIPGGNPGFINLRNDSRVIELIKRAYISNKLIAAICAGPAVLSDAGILKNKYCTIYPGMEEELEKGQGKVKKELVVVDKNIITSQGPATALLFAIKIVEKILGKEVAGSIRKKALVHLM
jgi:4-methyl-5(b-hydroxyethyl)-thiazole monophosphate biosynthesis